MCKGLHSAGDPSPGADLQAIANHGCLYHRLTRFYVAGQLTYFHAWWRARGAGGLIENASVRDPAPPQKSAPRRFRSRLATIRELINDNGLPRF